MQQKIKRDVEVKLTEHEIVAKAQVLAGLHAEAADIQKELSEFTKERKAEIKERTDRISQICREIEGGTALKTIECDVYKNHERNTVEYWHDGKLVDERGMEEADKQENIFDAGNTDPIIDTAEQVFDETFPTT